MMILLHIHSVSFSSALLIICADQNITLSISVKIAFAEQKNEIKLFLGSPSSNLLPPQQ